MVQISEQKRSDLALWFSSKPKYPLHSDVFTKIGIRGCITGMEQSFQGGNSLWRYQLTQVATNELDRPVSSWWAEEDIDYLCQPTLNLQEYDAGSKIDDQCLSGLDRTVQFVQEYGQKALEEYRDRGVMRELRISFWDVLREGVSDSPHVLTVEDEQAIAQVDVQDNVYALSPSDGDSKEILLGKYHALEALQESYALRAIEKHSSLPVPDYAPVEDEFTYGYFDPVRTKQEYANTLLHFEAPTPVRDATLAWRNIADTDLKAALEEVESGPLRKVQEDVLIALGFDREVLAKGRSYGEAVETDRGCPISYQQAKDAAFSDDLICQTQARSPLLHKYLQLIQDGVRGSIRAKLEEDWQAAMHHDVARDLGMRGLNDYLRENPHHIEDLLSKAEAHAFHEMLDVIGMLRSLSSSEICDEERRSEILAVERDYEREYGAIKGGDVEKQGPLIKWAKARLKCELSYAGNRDIEMYGYFNDESYWGFTINIPDYAETGEGGPIFTVENGKVTLDNVTRSPMLMEKLEGLQSEFPASEQGQTIA